MQRNNKSIVVGDTSALVSLSIGNVLSKCLQISRILIPQKVYEELNEISLFRIGQEVRSDAGVRAPVKTGTLRRSLTNRASKGAVFREKKNRVEVGSNLSYAMAQEYGNFKHTIGSRLFLTKAFQKQINGRAEKIYSEEFDNVIK